MHCEPNRSQIEAIPGTGASSAFPLLVEEKKSDTSPSSGALLDTMRIDDGWTEGRMDAMDGRMDERMDGRMDIKRNELEKNRAGHT